MKNFRPTHFALLLSLAIASRPGLGQAAPAEKGTSEAPEGSPEQLATQLDDHDPYFIESTAITSTSGPHSITRSMLQDRQGQMWFATWEGIIGYDGATFTNYMNKEGLRRYHTFALLEDRSGNLWFGTIGAGVYRYDGKSFTNFTTKDGLANDRIGCMLQDSHGTIWIGTQAGISRFDGKSFQNLTATEGLVDGDVNSIVEAKNGDFWIGTRGHSYVYDGASFTPITKPDGLAFQNVRTILEDRAGSLWLGGNDGLWRYDGQAYTQHSPKFTGFLYAAKDGRIWVSAMDGTEGYDMSLYLLEKGASPSDPRQLRTVIDVDGQVFGITEDAKGDIWFGTERGACRYDHATFHYYED